MKKTCICSFLLPILLVLASCAAPALRLGDVAMRRGDYDSAVAHFENAVRDHPDDFKAHRGLGRALYHLKEYDRAVESLQTARRMRPKDGLTTLYLGLAMESKDDPAAAEGVYEQYLAAAGRSRVSRRIRGRLLYLRNEGIRQQAKKAVLFETTLVRDTSSIPTVAVLPFALSGTGVDSLRPLGKGLAAAVSYDLFQVKSIRVVERLRLQSILDELGLVKSGVVDRATSPRLGMLVGADQLVNSSLEFLKGDEVAVQTGIVDVSDATYRPAAFSEERYARLWALQKEITFAVIDSLGIKLTPAERNAIKKISTRKFPAFLAFSEGLDDLDRGRYAEAQAAFNKAVRIDPGFKQAASLKDEAGLLSKGGVPKDEFEATVAAEFSTGPGFDVEEAADFFDITEPVDDPRNDDDPVVGSGTATVGGSIP